MKQQISIEQYAELPEKQQLYFLEWMEQREYSHLASIGQLIAFLNEHLSKRIWIGNDKRNNTWHVQTQVNDYRYIEVCDALWEAVTDVF